MEEILIQQRTEKRATLIRQGVEPYGRRFERTHTIAQAREQFQVGNRVRVAGRLVAIRSHGKSAFADIKDEKGKIQVYVKQGGVSDQDYAFFESLDLGDIIGCEGEFFKTRSGEESIHVSGLWLLAKSLHPLPEKWHGLKDVEIRYRHRYVDLIVNDSVREVFAKRSQIIQRIRHELDERRFLEVETPMMQAIPGGAIARPFVTHHNALNLDLYLRIAPELYLKRLLVGGFERVYEINRNFRNEGLSRKHNPEFTMLEVYQAYADYTDMMRLCEELLVTAAQSCGSPLGKETGVPPWKRIGYCEAFQQFLGINLDQQKDLRGLVVKSGIEILPTDTEVDLLNSLFEKLIEPKLVEPTFITDYPAAMCPLAKTKKDQPDIAERFELFIQGIEIANAYSEQNDPLIQRKKFEEQLALARQKADHTPVMDEDYIRALEYGMPPAGGLGIGIDRLVMLLTGQDSIRDVILFPQMRPEV